MSPLARNPPRAPIRVLIVDDSALVRKTVRELIERDPDLTVVGAASDGVQALQLVSALRPDVVTLDLHMPVMDGMACLLHLVQEHRQPVVVLSTLALDNTFSTFKALALGAVDYVTKPGSGQYLVTLEELGEQLRSKVRIAAQVPRSKIGRRPTLQPPPEPPSPGAGREKAQVGSSPGKVEPLQVVGIGGSTGAAVALEAMLRLLPGLTAISLMVAQHIPEGFSRDFARYLDSVSNLRVKEAEDGETIRPRWVLLAPGGAHLRVQRTASSLLARVDRKSPAHFGFRPSINVLFYSLAIAQRRQAVGVLLSGMGEDGVNGLEAIHKLGGRTLVQDRHTSVVFDMAERAMKKGIVDRVLALEKLPGALVAR